MRAAADGEGGPESGAGMLALQILAQGLDSSKFRGPGFWSLALFFNPCVILSLTVPVSSTTSRGWSSRFMTKNKCDHGWQIK